MPAPPAPRGAPRIALVIENQATGGVTTVLETLRHGLTQDRPDRVRLLHGHRIAPVAWWHAARHSDVLLAANAFRAAHLAWLLGRLQRKPVIVWVHGPMQQVLASAAASQARQARLRWLYRQIRHFVFVSDHARTSMESFLGAPLPPERWTVIPNAVTASTAPRSSGHGAATDTVALGYVGRLAPEKAPLRLLQMLRLLPPAFQLTLVGDGPLRAALQEAGRDLVATGRLRFAGELPRERAFDPAWRMTLLASRYEGSPISILESVAAGIPFVAPPIPALQEAAPGAAARFLAADGSPAGLAAAVQAVLALSPEHREAGMACVRARHDHGAFLRAWESVLHRAAGEC